MRCRVCSEPIASLKDNCQTCNETGKSLVNLVHLHLHQNLFFCGRERLLRFRLLNASKDVLMGIAVAVRSDNIKFTPKPWEKDAIGTAEKEHCKIEDLVVPIIPQKCGMCSLNVELSFFNSYDNLYVLSGEIEIWVTEQSDNFSELEGHIAMQMSQDRSSETKNERYALDKIGGDIVQMPLFQLDADTTKMMADLGCPDALLPGQIEDVQMALTDYVKFDLEYNQLFGGKSVSDYKIGKFIGAGSMTETWEVRNEKLPEANIQVLKILKKEVYRNQRVQNGVRRALAKNIYFDHPSVASTINVIDEHGLLGFISPYYTGPNLREIIEQRIEAIGGIDALQQAPLFSLAEAANIIVRVCEAVAYVHTEHNVLHLNLRPENILIANPEAIGKLKQGDVIVTDFGLTQSLDRKTRHFIYNKPRKLKYKAPEQEDLNHTPWGRWTDLYSIGLLLFELLTGKTLLSRKTLFPSTRWPDLIPPEIDQLLEITLDDQILERPKTADEILLRLMPYMPDEALDEREISQRQLERELEEYRQKQTERQRFDAERQCFNAERQQFKLEQQRLMYWLRDTLLVISVDERFIAATNSQSLLSPELHTNLDTPDNQTDPNAVYAPKQGSWLNWLGISGIMASMSLSLFLIVWFWFWPPWSSIIAHECKPNEVRACGSDVGRCRKGQQLCLNGKWSPICENEIKPVAEMCNGLDDDCDGTIDNNAPCPPCQSCQNGQCQNIISSLCPETPPTPKTDQSNDIPTSPDVKKPSKDLPTNDREIKHPLIDYPHKSPIAPPIKKISSKRRKTQPTSKPKSKRKSKPKLKPQPTSKPKTETRNQKPETRNQKPETRNQ